MPKKRGPKTDVLEALLKRVDGLEAKLKEKNAESEQPSSSESTTQEPQAAESATKRQPAERDAAEPVAKRRATEEKTMTTTPNVTELSLFSPQTSTTGWVAPRLYILASALLNTNRILITTIETPPHPPYRRMLFSTPISTASTTSLSTSWMKRSSGNASNSTSFRPFCSTLLLPLPLGMLPSSHSTHLQPFRRHTCYCDQPSHLSYRHTPHPNGFRAAVKLGDDYASRARSAIDIDEPSIDNLQAIVLLAIAYTASGKGRKAFMLISTYICPLSMRLP